VRSRSGGKPILFTSARNVGRPAQRVHVRSIFKLINSKRGSPTHDPMLQTQHPVVQLRVNLAILIACHFTFALAQSR